MKHSSTPSTFTGCNHLAGPESSSTHEVQRRGLGAEHPFYNGSAKKQCSSKKITRRRSPNKRAIEAKKRCARNGSYRPSRRHCKTTAVLVCGYSKKSAFFLKKTTPTFCPPRPGRADDQGFGFNICWYWLPGRQKHVAALRCGPFSVTLTSPPSLDGVNSSTQWRCRHSSQQKI